METHQSSSSNGLPDAREAAAALRAADEASAVVTDARTPLWFFLALGGITAVIGPVIAMTPDSALGRGLMLGGLVVWLAALALLLRRVVNSVGVTRPLTWRQTLLPMVACGLAGAGAAALNAYGLEWALPAFTVLLGAVIVGFGVHHNVRRKP